MGWVRGIPPFRNVRERMGHPSLFFGGIILGGMGLWNPTLSQRARKDGAPVVVFWGRILGGMGLWNPTPFAKSAKGWAPVVDFGGRIPRGMGLWNPTPFDCAQGRLFRRVCEGLGPVKTFTTGGTEVHRGKAF